MKLFNAGYKVTLNRVRDSITVKEGKEALELYVDSDANSLMNRLHEAQKRLQSVNEDPSEENKTDAATFLSTAIFGADQTKKLFDFYHGDAGCVVTICGMYFSDKRNGLGKKITKIQKKGK